MWSPVCFGAPESRKAQGARHAGHGGCDGIRTHRVDLRVAQARLAVKAARVAPRAGGAGPRLRPERRVAVRPAPSLSRRVAGRWPLAGRTLAVRAAPRLAARGAAAGGAGGGGAAGGLAASSGSYQLRFPMLPSTVDMTTRQPSGASCHRRISPFSHRQARSEAHRH